MKADGRSFLNLNDCRIVDALPGIARREGDAGRVRVPVLGRRLAPNVLRLLRASSTRRSRRKKVRAKFNSVAQAIKTLQPRVYLPSAGPPCFLDPALVHLNFEPVNIFPRDAAS